MGCITICISDELEIAFRRIARLSYGEKQGKMSRAAEEALYEWCQKKIEELEVDEKEIFD
ncbi:hypothetical protein [Methanobacterium alcaliphilum]|uniref:hypothetical protein n=1 Tax=Methanobacterium alcaliphilum TaxID=392018 RepID=UPI002009F8B6|nr:hypothetical protein [Methanobacterium alcaliphilum]MCK9150596.1 hypothetical protein [Methanobacterium alcaliphilum]